MEEDKSNIFVESYIIAPIQKIWNAWTDPNLIKQWFGSDPNGKVFQAALDVKSEGRFEISFMDADTTEHTCFGVYKDVQEPNRLTFTWHWKNEPGIESFIIVSLTQKENGTLLQLEHLNPGAGSMHDYVKGWQLTFLKLERILGNQS